MQDLLEGIFINMANLTLARRDSYLDYLRASTKQDKLTAFLTQCSPPYALSVFGSAEEISHYEDRRLTSSTQKKPNCYHPCTSPAKSSQESDWNSGVPAWKQIKHRQQSKKDCARSIPINRNRPRSSNHLLLYYK